MGYEIVVDVDVDVVAVPSALMVVAQGESVA
jgi:hypothetical protein